MYSYAVLNIWSELAVHHSILLLYCRIQNHRWLLMNCQGRLDIYSEQQYFGVVGSLHYLFSLLPLDWVTQGLFIFFICCSKQAVIMFWIRRQGETNVESVVVIILHVRHLQVLSTVLIMVCLFCLFLNLNAHFTLS